MERYLWGLFKSSGSVNAYLNYKNSTMGSMENSAYKPIENEKLKYMAEGSVKVEQVV
jgi:hypothetical protein